MRAMTGKQNTRQSRTSLTVASLYSGCGGFDHGFKNVGFQLVGASDIEPTVVQTFNQNLPPIARVLDLGHRSPDHVSPDVLIAGAPCQGFSTAGKRLVSDPRNRLMVRAGEIAISMRPRVFILENVPGALSGQHEGHWRLVEDMLRWHGFNVRTFVAQGCESGVAQSRKRLFMLAWIGSDCIRIEPDKLPNLTLSQALNNVAHLADHDPILLPPASREGRIAAKILPGQKLSNVRSSEAAVHTWDIPEVYGRVGKREIEILEAVLVLRRRERRRNFGDGDPVSVTSIRDWIGNDVQKALKSLVSKKYLRVVNRRFELVHTYNGKFRRLRWDAPSPTVDTHFGDASLFLHPSDNRAFSAREAARIQGFPDGFKFSGSRNSKFKMIGNAVPPPMAQRLAVFVRGALL